MKPSVKLRQGDMVICKECNEIRFGTTSKKTNGPPNSAPKPKGVSAEIMTIDKASAAVLASNIVPIDKMELAELFVINTNNMIPMVQASLSSILPDSTDRTEIANHALNICQKLKERVNARISDLELQQPTTVSQSIFDFISSPLRRGTAQQASSTDVTTPMTANKIQCISTCQFGHLETTSKATQSCSLCQEQYHRTCIGLKTRPTIWICVECKEIPRTVKILTTRVGNQEREITNLRQENATLAKLIQEQKTELVDLRVQTCLVVHDKNDIASTSDKGMTKDEKSPPSSESDSGQTETNHDEDGADKQTTLLIGDSIIRDIGEKGLCNTIVKCIRGGKVSDIKEALKKTNVDTFETIIVHAGTNNCTSDKNLQSAISEYDSMVQDLKDRAPNTKKVLSTVCPRSDNDRNQDRVDKLNDVIRRIANEKACNVVDNDEKFKLRDNCLDAATLDRKGLHLSKLGTNRLLRNINATHAVIPTRKSSVQDKSVRRRHTPRQNQSSHTRGYHHTRDSRAGSPSYHRDTTRSHHRQHHHDSRNSYRSPAYRGCYNCGGLNHNRDNCRYSEPVECYNCGSYGHLSYFCKF